MRYYFQIITYDPRRPWIVTATEHRTIELAEDANPYEWANEHCPEPNVRAVRQTGPPPHRTVRGA